MRNRIHDAIVIFCLFYASSLYCDLGFKGAIFPGTNVLDINSYFFLFVIRSIYKLFEVPAAGESIFAIRVGLVPRNTLRQCDRF